LHSVSPLNSEYELARKGTILIVEDEEAIRLGLEDTFVFHGYEVESVANGREALEMALQRAFDLIILDIMLPEVDGFTICEAIREKDREQPIIMLTAKDLEQDIIQGLRLGADDYITKPFSVQELVLRAEAILRRSSSAARVDKVFEIHPFLTLNTGTLTGEVHVGGCWQTVEFTRRETNILSYLKSNRDHPVSRDELLVKVWGYNRASRIETRTVDIHIAKLRKKIEENPQKPERLVTIRGEGYKLISGESDENP
jgi:two-component system response regulator RegX3